MMDYQDQEQKRRIKIIVIATIAAIVVLALGVWVIVAAVNSIKRGGNTEVANTETAPLTSQATEPEQSDEDRQTNNPNASDPASQYSPIIETTPTTTPEAMPADTTEDIPSTGPVDTALAAILVGVAVYLYTTNIQLVKKQIAKRQA